MLDWPRVFFFKEDTGFFYDRKKIFALLGLVFLLVIALVGFYFLTISNSSDNLPSLTKSLQLPDIASQEEIPFYNLTIPGLRSREYKSSLGNLQKLNETQTYTSYLTSYDSDGLRVNGLLTIPKGEAPSDGWSAIVFVHGYIPPAQYRTTENYASHVDYLGKNGFVVFKIDLRGHGNSEGDPGGAYYSSDYIIDTLNAYSALQNADFVDANRIGLWGHSMAGNVVMRSFAAKPEIPAVVIWAGAVYTYEDFGQYRISDNSYRPPQMSNERVRRRQELFDTHGEFDSQSSFWQQVAPTNYLTDLKGSIQIHHAVNDNVVNIGYSRNLAGLLKAASIPSELYEYSSGGHNITGSAFTQAMQRTVNFFHLYTTPTRL